MIINKTNLKFINDGDFCLHDLLISSLYFDIKSGLIVIELSDYVRPIYKLTFHDIFDFYFMSMNRLTDTSNEELFDWELVSDEYEYVRKLKEQCLIKKCEWNTDLFSIRMLLTNIDEIIITCKSITVENI